MFMSASIAYNDEPLVVLLFTFEAHLFKYKRKCIATDANDSSCIVSTSSQHQPFRVCFPPINVFLFFSIHVKENSNYY